MKPAIGDVVAYRGTFLRSVGIVTGDIPFARGRLTGVRAGVATVEWNLPGIPAGVRLCNLTAIKGGVIKELP